MPHLFKRKYVRNHRNSVVMNGLSPKEADVQSDTSSHIEGIIQTSNTINSQGHGLNFWKQKCVALTN